MHIELFLLLVGGVILLGFAARWLFEKSRIPDILLLMGLGMILGRYLSVDARGLIYSFAPYFGTLALIMILFEGGLHIDPRQALDQAKPSLLLSILCFLISAGAMTALARLGWGWEILPSAMLGTALGCTSSAIVIPVAHKIQMSEKTRTLLDLEAAFSDTYAVIAMLILMSMAESKDGWLAHGLGHLASSFGVAAVLALLVGVAWLVVLEHTKHRPLSYLLTFAVIILLYAGVETLKGSGAIAVLLFGILVTEAKHLVRWLPGILPKAQPGAAPAEAHATIQWFHQEMTFLVRTFFFVYLGLLFQAERLNPHVIWAALALGGLAAAGRALSVRLLGGALSGHPKGLLCAFFPRGLVSAVLASLPMARGISGTEDFLDYAVPVIIATNLMMTAWLLLLRQETLN